MMYKKVLLGVFLVPFAVMGHGGDVEAQMKELKDYRFKKELELSDLGKMISEKDEFLRSLKSLMINFIVGEMHENNLNEHEREAFGLRIDESSKAFQEALTKAFIAKKNIKQFFVEELLNEKESGFETLKFLQVRHVSEQNLLKTLVERYGDCQQELFEVDYQLDELQKIAAR